MAAIDRNDSEPPERTGAGARLHAARYGLLWSGAILGLIVYFVGLAWDLYLHAEDETLAAREGVLTLSNPGHVLLFAGTGLLAASLLGVAGAWLSDRRVGGDGLAGRSLRFAAVPLVGLGAAGSIWLASAERDTVHDHGTAVSADHAHAGDAQALAEPASQGAGASAADHAHTPASQPAASSGPAMSEENAHFHHAEVAVTAEQMRAALALLDAVKEKTAKFEDPRVALRAGYIQVTQDLAGIAAHFVKLDYLTDGRELDPDYPEVLLYTKRLDGTWRLVGVMFSGEDAAAEGPAPGYFGALDAWHYHENLCFTLGGVRVVKGQSECVGGQFTKRTAWELHVWTQPGAAGIFSHDYAPISPGAFPPARLPAATELQFRQ